MTVAEIKAMINGMNDNDTVKFIGTRVDRDGYENDCFVTVKAIASKKCELIVDEYGCKVAVDFR